MKKKISVITGGRGGMGKAVAKELGKDGSVVLSSRNEAELHLAKKELDDLGCEAYVFPADVREPANVEALASYASSLGDVVNVIHTAGVSPTDTGWREIIATNAVGTANMVRSFFPVITEGGVMINFASLAAYCMETQPSWLEVYDKWNQPDFQKRMEGILTDVGDDDFILGGMAYVISKRFCIRFTQMNVMRFAAKHCRIVSVSPGPYLTPMHQKLIDNQPDAAQDQLELIPCGRWGFPYEIGALTAFLCSHGAGFISGVDILTDAGQIANTFVPQIET